MYSFVLRTHQKVDRMAYRHLSELLETEPPIDLKSILHFEGPRGPDAARLKKNGNVAPWHFYQPSADNEKYLNIVRTHHDNLAKEIRKKDAVRAAFEAAWLAHALVDGLTPAHHFPYEIELENLRQSGKETRQTIAGHFFVKGTTSRDSLQRSFELIGPKGLLTTHTSFEAGAAMIIMPLRYSVGKVTEADIELLRRSSLIEVFEIYVQEIDQLKLYERFYKEGWSPALARDVRRELAPRLAKMVTLAWYSAYETATKPAKKSSRAYH